MPLIARLGILTAVMALAFAVFTWPSANLQPRDVPVGVVGATPPALADAGAFDVRRYASPAEAREAVRDRVVYGAIAGGTAYVATGASPAIATALRDAAAGANVVDLAPGTREDPRATTLASLALPLTILGIITAVLGFFTSPTLGGRLAVIGGGGVIAGTLGALFTQTWLGALPGDWLGIAGVVGLGVMSVALFVTGLTCLLGRAGIAVGALLMVFVGNPWSGLSSAPELLPEVAGTVGQLLPTGAAGNALRSVAYFDGAAAGEHLVVLAVWALGGLALMAAAGLRSRGPVVHAAAAHA